MESMPKIIPA